MHVGRIPHSVRTRVTMHYHIPPGAICRYCTIGQLSLLFMHLIDRSLLWAMRSVGHLGESRLQQATTPQQTQQRWHSMARVRRFNFLTAASLLRALCNQTDWIPLPIRQLSIAQASHGIHRGCVRAPPESNQQSISVIFLSSRLAVCMIEILLTTIAIVVHIIHIILQPMNWHIINNTKELVEFQPGLPTHIMKPREHGKYAKTFNAIYVTALRLCSQVCFFRLWFEPEQCVRLINSHKEGMLVMSTMRHGNDSRWSRWQ